MAPSTPGAIPNLFTLVITQLLVTVVVGQKRVVLCGIYPALRHHASRTSHTLPVSDVERVCPPNSLRNACLHQVLLLGRYLGGCHQRLSC